MSGLGTRQDLLGLQRQEVEAALASHFEARGERAFRVRQVLPWLYERDAMAFDEMTDLSARERAALAEAFALTSPALARAEQSTDGTVKHLWRMDDGELLESVLIPSPDRLTLCLSSQAGCAMACVFCATGWSGYRRQLTTGEIVAQYRGARRWAQEHGLGAITNIVFMGMGEPLANRPAVMPALSLLNGAYGMGARRITVSTVGVVPGILELAAMRRSRRGPTSTWSASAPGRKAAGRPADSPSGAGLEPAPSTAGPEPAPEAAAPPRVGGRRLGPLQPVPGDDDGCVDVQGRVPFRAYAPDAEALGRGAGDGVVAGAVDDDRAVAVEARRIAEVDDVEAAIAQLASGGAGEPSPAGRVEDLQPPGRTLVVYRCGGTGGVGGDLRSVAQAEGEGEDERRGGEEQPRRSSDLGLIAQWHRGIRRTRCR
jgi:hypothetical protein